MRLGLKLAYGVGQVSDGVKQAAFNTFLFFYYNQVLGLSATLAGLASLLALVVDAITDPMIGLLSDRFNSRWGRRHPFMLMGVLPFAVSMYAIFDPPTALAGLSLFTWMLFWAIMIRLSLTLFFVPHLALGAELSNDYHERTSLIGFRVFFTYASILSISVIALVTFFKPTNDFQQGMLNPSGYPSFGFFCGIVGALFMLYSTIATKKTIPTLRVASTIITDTHPLLAFTDVFKALSLRSFRILFSANLLFSITGGMIQALLVYLATYIYGFTSDQFAIVTMALVISVIIAPLLSQFLAHKSGKKNALAISIVAGSVLGFFPVILYLLTGLDYLSSQQKLLLVFLGNGLANAFFIAYVILIDSMLTDTIDENELLTGKREEGLFFSARTFCSKASYGLGAFFSGLALDLIQFPRQMDPAKVPPETLNKLAFIAGPVCLSLFIATILLSRNYPLNQEKHTQIMLALKTKGLAS